MPWTFACDADDLEDEDLIRFDHNGRTYAICRGDDGVTYCTQGLCPQDGAHLSGGLVEGARVECPGHGGFFDLRDGRPEWTGDGVALATYPASCRGAGGGRRAGLSA